MTMQAQNVYNLSIVTDRIGSRKNLPRLTPREGFSIMPLIHPYRLIANGLLRPGIIAKALSRVKCTYRTD